MRRLINTPTRMGFANALTVREGRNTEVSRKEASIALTLLFLTILMVGALSTAEASTESRTAQPMRFVHYDRDEGLSQSAVNQIVQDSSGFMWFATESGLNRFDGYDFTVYRRIRDDAGTMSNDFITDMALDSSGDLWITTDGGGLIQRHRDSNKLRVYRNDPGDPGSLVNDNLRRVLADPRGWIWVGTMRHGLSRVNPATGEIVTYRHEEANADSLSDDRVYSLWLDADGSLWAGTGTGLDRLDPESGIVKRYSIALPGESDDVQVLAIRRVSSGDLWLGTAEHGLVRLDENTGEFESYRHDRADVRSLASDRVEVIYEDSADRLWIGTNDGLHVMNVDRNSFTRYRHDPTDPSSLSDSYVIAIFEDRSGVLWFGTKTGGVNKWNARSWLFGHVRPASGSGEDNQTPKITSFTRDKDGQLWVGTFGSGLLMLDENLELRTQLQKGANGNSGLSDDTVMALLTDREGRVWAGTMHGGLNRIDPASGKITIYEHEPGNPDSLAANGIMSLYGAQDGTIWIGTFGGGVSRYDREADNFVNYPHSPDEPTSLSNPNATAIAEDAEGMLWVATSGGGINRLMSATGRWVSYQNDPARVNSLSGNAVYSLHVDKSGSLWAGTRSGLNRFLPQGDGTFQHVTQSDGLPNDAIYGILSDANGRLWLSTNYGISRYDPNTGDIRNFHLSDGLQGEEFNFGAYYAAEDGTLFFGGNNGFNAFDPLDIQFRARPPTVIVTNVGKFNKPADVDVPYEVLTNLDLDHTDDMVSFDFSAVEYTAPSRNSYAYKLEGFDRDWVQAGNSRSATYTDLPGGNYIFRVRAANSDGVWSRTDATLAVVVEHPPWLRPWAFALYFLVFVTIIYLLYQIQARKLAREAEYSKRLETEVRDRTSELAESNSELSAANHRLREASLTDPLTGLHNRRYLFEEVLKDLELEPGAHDPRYADEDGPTNTVFVMIDLDKFKPINDVCGHLAGDRVLLKVRDVLQSACRASDIIIRWGGDEFLVVGQKSTYGDASMLAERIRSEIAQTKFSVGLGRVERTTCSIGFACYPFIQDAPDLLDWEQVLAVADTAMYEAKAERNAWVGIQGNSWDRSSKSLYQALQSNLGMLIDDGHASVKRSLSISETKTA